jgi:hypothetical protein
MSNSTGAADVLKCIIKLVCVSGCGAAAVLIVLVLVALYDTSCFGFAVFLVALVISRLIGALRQTNTLPTNLTHLGGRKWLSPEEAASQANGALQRKITP